MSFLPAVVRAEHVGGLRLRVVFNDSSENTIDFESWLEGPIFEPLKNPNYFARFFIDGGTIVWPNGADIAPETLYDVAGRRQRRNTRLQQTKSRQRTTKTRKARSRLSARR